jgi:RNA polymerase sigma-70 factor, ECF subfamily
MSPPDPESTPSLLVEHGRFLRAVARRLVGNDADADDVVQETFVRALTRRPRHDNVRAWLVAIARNVFLDRRSADEARRRREAADAERLAVAQHTDDDPFAVAALQAAMRALPADYRVVLELRYYAERSPVDIAAQLGVPLATVKTRLHRALSLLRSDLGQRFGAPANWRPKLLALVSAPVVPVRTGAGVSLSTTVVGALLMKKTLAVFVVLAAAAVLLPWWGGPPAAGASAATARDAAAVVADAGAAAPRGAAASSLAHERAPAAVRDPNEVGRVAQSGRVLDAATGQGLPFAMVRVREGSVGERLRADRHGRFRTVDRYSAACELLFEGPVAGGVAVTARPKEAAPTATEPQPGVRVVTPEEMLEAAGVVVSAPVLLPDPVAVTAAEERWWSRRDFGAEVEVRVAVGPTFFFSVPPSVSPDAPVAWLAALVEDERADVTSLRRFMPWAVVAASVDPDHAGRWWVRAPAQQRHAGAPRVGLCLRVFDDAGFWRAEAPAPDSVGVHEADLPLEWTNCGIVSGHVLDTHGEPLAGVACRLRSSGTGYHATAVSDAAGRYHAGHLPAGDAVVRLGDERVTDGQSQVCVLAGAIVEHDLRVQARPIGGTIAGRITSRSGRHVPGVAIWLTSRHDQTIWRTANLRVVREAGAEVVTFSFEDVPRVECEVTLRSWTPCAVVRRQWIVTPPHADVHFELVDDLPRASVRFGLHGVAEGAGGELFLRSEDGWHATGSLEVARDAEFELPVGQRVTYHLAGPGVRVLEGSFVVEPTGNRITLRASAGFSAKFVTMSRRNYRGLPDLELFADGRSVGRTDAEGCLWIDLPTRPGRLTLDEALWRIYDTPSHDSDIDPDGSYSFDESAGSLHVYVSVAG